jgi:hypothetical protein
MLALTPPFKAKPLASKALQVAELVMSLHST